MKTSPGSSLRSSPFAIATAAAVIALSSCVNAVDEGGAMGMFLDDKPRGADQEAVHAVCGVGPTVFGIDVSSWQGNINWGTVAGNGVKFAIIRTGDGGYRDPDFAQNWSGAKAHGIIRGAYQFFRSNEDPIVQADTMLSMMGKLEDGDLPPMIDVETTDGVGNATRAAKVKQWLDHVQAATGVKPMIYTGGYFWDSNVGADDGSYPLVHAGYTGGSCPSTISNHWSTWTIWQYTDSVNVGIGGGVDGDRFNGDMAALKKLTKGGGGSDASGGDTTDPNAQHWFVGDFNGDHKVDLGKVWNDGGAITTDVHISSGSAFDMKRFATKQGGFIDSMHWVVGDFSGDGKADLLDWWNDGGTWTVDVHVSNGNGFDLKRFATKQGGYWDAQKWFKGDFDGDGTMDMMKLWDDGGEMTADVHLSNGNGFDMHRFATKQGGIWDGMKWFVGDFDGDGRDDIMKLWDDNGTMTADVHVSDGNSFHMERWATQQGGFWDAQKWFVGDFNGDGKTDLMKLWNDNGTMTADVHLSTGSGFVMHRFATGQGGYWDAQQWHVGDFDGDGRADIMKLWDDGGAMTADVHLSSGSAFSMHRFATKQGGIWDGMHWYVADFNGDGKADLAKTWNDGGTMDVDVHTSDGSAFTMQRFATKQGGMW